MYIKKKLIRKQQLSTSLLGYTRIIELMLYMYSGQCLLNWKRNLCALNQMPFYNNVRRYLLGSEMISKHGRLRGQVLSIWRRWIPAANRDSKRWASK